MIAPWWQTTTIYQVYPRSFQDTTGSGVGDLRGVTRRLDYLANTLGVGAIWLSPFYRSPMADFGYDVADYTDVDPLFGTLDDFDALLEGAHRVGLKVIIDWVPNHTSDQHPWFLESRAGRSSPRRDWYVWRDPGPDGAPPNNWLSLFGGPAWEFDNATQQYYLHTFLREQPDLDWRNPDVKEAMFAGLRFWLDRGVDGFRIDVAHHIMKDPELRDNPPAPPGFVKPFKDLGEYDRLAHVHDLGHPDVHGVYRELREMLDAYEPERYSVGEIHIADWDEWASYYGAALDELHMPFNLALVYAPWSATAVREHVEAVEAAVPEGAWPNYVLGNHDDTRLATRVGAEQSRVAAMLLLTLRGTPTLYYGDELGLQEVEIPSEAQQDPQGRNLPGAGRDGCRTPMQWDASPNAGFAPARVKTPWLPFTADQRTANVAVQQEDPHSILNLYRELLALRRARPALQLGDIEFLEGMPDDVLAYERAHGADRMIIALNFSDAERSITLGSAASVVLSTDATAEQRPVAGSEIRLRPHEGLIFDVAARSTG